MVVFRLMGHLGVSFQCVICFTQGDLGVAQYAKAIAWVVPFSACVRRYLPMAWTWIQVIQSDRHGHLAAVVCVNTELCISKSTVQPEFQQAGTVDGRNSAPPKQP